MTFQPLQLIWFSHLGRQASGSQDGGPAGRAADLRAQARGGAASYEGGATRHEGVVTLAQGYCLGKPAQASLRTKPCGWLVVVG